MDIKIITSSKKVKQRVLSPNSVYIKLKKNVNLKSLVTVDQWWCGEGVGNLES